MTSGNGRTNRYDVIVVGGGHNGLVSAGLLARRGLRAVVLERRPQVGGAAVTEQPWGPDFKVTQLSYVVSLMPPTVLRELDLARHGYRVYPQHGYFAPFSDGRFLQIARRRSPAAARADRRSSRRAMPTASSAGTSGCAGSPRCSARCSARCRPSSAPSGRATCSISSPSPGASAGSPCAASRT